MRPGIVGRATETYYSWGKRGEGRGEGSRKKMRNRVSNGGRGKGERKKLEILITFKRAVHLLEHKAAGTSISLLVHCFVRFPRPFKTFLSHTEGEK